MSVGTNTDAVVLNIFLWSAINGLQDNLYLTILPNSFPEWLYQFVFPAAVYESVP